MSGRFQRAPKRIVVQELLTELSNGTADDDRTMAVLVTALCKGTFQDASPKGLTAVEGLKTSRVAEHREAAERRVEEESRRRDAEKARERAREAEARKRRQLRESFLALGHHHNSQERGFALERFLNNFFEFEKLNPQGSFRIKGEQIDGSFAWGGSTYLVEAKWVKDPVAGAEFGAFMYKIGGKTADTRGLYISINGYSPEAVEGLRNKGELRFVCIDGTHLLRALEPHRDFKALLDIVWRHASETGDAYLPVSSDAFLRRDT